MKTLIAITCLVFATEAASLAQGTFTPISDFNQTNSYQFSLGGPGNFANAFTTDSTGAVLSSITLSIIAFEQIVTLNADADGLPGASLTTLAYSSTDVNPTYQATTPYTLLANTTYWIVVTPNGFTQAGAGYSSWGMTSGSTLDAGSTWSLGSFAWQAGGNDWSLSAPGYLKFSVQVNAVPEPSTLALIGLGIAGLLAARRQAWPANPAAVDKA